MLPDTPKTARPVRKSAFSRALDRLQASTKKEPVTLTSNPAQPARPNEVVRIVRCAQTGRQYAVLYQRGAAPDAKFVPVIQRALPPSGAAGIGIGDEVIKRGAIPASEFREHSQWPCPCCERKLVYADVRCGRCGEWVCTGRSYLDRDGVLIFVCHAACGARGAVNGPSVESIEVERPADKPAPSAPAHVLPDTKALGHDRTPKLALNFGSPGKRK